MPMKTLKSQLKSLDKVAHYTLTKNYSLYTRLMSQFSLIVVHNSSYLVYYSAEDIDIKSTGGFFTFMEKKGVFQHTVGNKV